MRGLELAGEFLQKPGGGGKAGAVAGAEFLYPVSPQCLDGLIELGGIAESQMGAADHCVNLRHPGFLPGVLDGVHHSRMTAAEKKDQPPVSDYNQRLVIGNLVRGAAGVIAELPGVPPLESGFSRHLAGQEYPLADLAELIAQGKPSPRSSEKMLLVGDADGDALARVLYPVTPGEYCRMGKDLLAAAVLQKREESAGVVVMAVGQGDLPHKVEITVHAQGVVEEGLALAGVEQETSPIPLHQGGETVFAEGPRKRPDGIVAEDGDAHR